MDSTFDDNLMLKVDMCQAASDIGCLSAEASRRAKEARWRANKALKHAEEAHDQARAVQDIAHYMSRAARAVAMMALEASNKSTFADLRPNEAPPTEGRPADFIPPLVGESQEQLGINNSNNIETIDIRDGPVQEDHIGCRTIISGDTCSMNNSKDLDWYEQWCHNTLDSGRYSEREESGSRRDSSSPLSSNSTSHQNGSDNSNTNCVRHRRPYRSTSSCTRPLDAMCDLDRMLELGLDPTIIYENILASSEYPDICTCIAEPSSLSFQR